MIEKTCTSVSLSMNASVIYWPSTEPSIKRCICVNKRKNSGSRCQMVRVSWRQDASGVRISSRQRACGPQWPMVEQTQPRWGRSAAIVVRRILGQNNSLSPSSTHLPHTTNITRSRIKCERLYFYKEICSFVH